MISTELIDGQESITLNVANNSVTIIKSLGGMVYTLKLNGKDILFSDSESQLTENELFRGRFLFPFNDRIPDGKYKYNNQEYQFPINCDDKDSIHGLIYNRNMSEVYKNDSKDEVSIALETIINNSEFTGYPFSIGLKVLYTLTENDFTILFEVFNPGDKEAPFALGWHPYFTFGKNINASNLTFGSDRYYDVNKDLYYEGNNYSVKGSDLDFTNGQPLGDRDLDIAISLSNKGEFKLDDGDDCICVEFTKELFPAIQLFIPEDRLSIAIEPISAPSDTFNYPETGLKIISPGQRIIGTVNVRLSRN